MIERQVRGAGNRGDLKALRSLIQKNCSKFQKVWEKTSKSPIGFDCQHLFFDNVRTCYTADGRNGVPNILFKLPQCRAAEKIESAVVFESPLDQDSFIKCGKYSGYSSCIIGVTAHGWLMRYHLNTGKELQMVYLAPRYKFKSIAWETDLYRVVLKSTHIKNSARTEQTRSAQPSLLMYLAVFSVAPLEVLIVMPIDKNTFGQDTVDATISTGFLVTMHQSSLVQFYNFEEIVNNYSHPMKLGQPYQPQKLNPADQTVNETIRNLVGEYPHGLPLNVNLTSKPTPLFQVSSNNHFVLFGGNPWHYIVSPVAQDSVFHVKAVDGNVLAKDGVLSTDTLSIESDRAYFHGDHSGRILHIGANTLRCLTLREVLINKVQVSVRLETCFNLHFDSIINNENEGVRRYTSSGRLVKQRQDKSYRSPGYETIQDVDYEDDLDLLVVLSSVDSDNGCIGRIGLHDNQTGLCVKETLIHDWDQDCCHSIMMDRNVIVHVIKSPSGKFSSHMYRLETTGEK